MLRLKFSILLILLAFLTKANPAIVPKHELQIVTPDIHYYIDETDQLTINHIKQKPDSFFHSNREEYIDFGYTNHPIWIYLDLSSDITAPFLLFNNNSIDSIVAYSENEQNHLSLQWQGKKILEKDKSFHTLLPVIRLSNGSNKRIWLKIRNFTKITSFSLKVGNTAQVFGKIQNITLILAGFCFLMAIIFFSNIILYLIFRSDLILAFGLFNLMTLLFICTVSGMNMFFPGDYSYYISDYSTTLLCLLFISGIYMCSKSLNIRTQHPRYFIYLMVIAALCVLAIILNLIGMNKEAAIISGPFGIMLIPVYIIVSWKEYKRGELHAIYFFIGWLLYFCLVITIVLFLAKIIPPGEYLNYLTPSASIIDFFFFSVTIIFKINSYRIEKIKAEKEKLALIEKQNINLEKKVDERTKKLKELYDEIATQNEELFSQKDHISELNNSLEKTVEQRTIELQEIMISLRQRNHDLEQFSYIVSHNLRGPVATILGLTNLFNRQDMEDPINAEVILNIDRVVSSLDHIIRDLNYIISLKEPVNHEKKIVNLRSLTVLCSELLETDIDSSAATIITDFSQVENINSVPAYLQNIFYNLISNSIKYRKDKVLVVIHIKASLVNNHVVLSFSDNGIGIDLKNIEPNKIFKLYQRFNQNREGRGIGLFLVKSQVEALNGTIEVTSKLGEGTEFIITLPLISDSEIISN